MHYHADKLLVILATHNGGHRLARVLEGYKSQKLEKALWQIIVVDNASNDGTNAILDQYRESIPLISMFEENTGKNYALNRAVKSHRSEVMIFTDDDAIPQPDFLQAWNVLNYDLHEYAFFGGTVDLLFDADIPNWLNENNLPFDTLYAKNANCTGPIEYHKIYGPNMAIRGKVFEDGFLFNNSIGPDTKNKLYAMGSETEMCKRLAENGYRSYFLSGPRVEHIVRKDQCTKEFIAGRARRMGRGYARLLHSITDRPKIDIPGLRYMPHHGRQLIRKIKYILASGDRKIQAFWKYNLEGGYGDEVMEMMSKKPSEIGM